MHLFNMDEVLARLVEAGFQSKQAKCAFLLPLVDNLGHTIVSEGLQLKKEKVCAIHVVEALAPQNVLQLCSFLGLVNYYKKFFLEPPAHSHHSIGCRRRSRNGTGVQSKSRPFRKPWSKCLAHYNPQKALIVSEHASQYGVGAILSQVIEDGYEQLLTFVFQSLSVAKRYAQEEKEGLAVIFAVKKFHKAHTLLKKALSEPKC